MSRLSGCDITPITDSRGFPTPTEKLQHNFANLLSNPRCSFPPQISAVFLHRAFLMSFCGQAYESVKIRSIRLIRVLLHFTNNFYMHPGPKVGILNV